MMKSRPWAERSEKSVPVEVVGYGGWPAVRRGVS